MADDRNDASPPPETPEPPTEHGPDSSAPSSPVVQQPGSSRKKKRKRTGSTGRPGLIPSSRRPKKRTNAKGKRPPSANRAPKATPAEVDARITYVLDLIVSGVCRRRMILRRIASDFQDQKIDWTWRDVDEQAQRNVVAVRTVELYMQRATDELMKIADEARAVAKSKARARYEKALAGAVADEAWDTVRKIVRDMARLDGLEPTSRGGNLGTIEVAHTGSVEHTHTHAVGGSIDDRANRITDLLGVANQRRLAAQSTAANN